MQLFANNAEASLDGAISTTSTSISLSAGSGSKFPSPTGGDYFIATLFQKVGTSEINYEIVKCTARSGDVVTVVRAQEGTTAKAFITGDFFELRVTAGTMDAKQATLVSGSNIRTAGGQNLVGSGDAPIVAPETHAATAKTTPVDADELGITDSAASWGLKKLTFANLKAWIGGLFVSKSGDTINGNLNFGGTGRRITGDFSNTVSTNRVLVQSSTPDGATSLELIPNGAGNVSGVGLGNSSDPTNTSWLFVGTSGTTDHRLSGNARGNASYLPMTFYAGGSERLRIDTNGNVGIGASSFGSLLYAYTSSATNYSLVAKTPMVGLAAGSSVNMVYFAGGRANATDGLRIINYRDTTADSQGKWETESYAIERNVDNAAPQAAVRFGASVLVFSTAGVERMRIDASGNALVTGGALGYGVGSGGTVTQPTSNTSTVTLNKQNGVITLANGSITGGARIAFPIENNLIGVNSTVVVHGVFDGSAPAIASLTVQVEYVQPGKAYISIKNNDGSAVATDGVKIKFAVFAGSAS